MDIAKNTLRPQNQAPGLRQHPHDKILRHSRWPLTCLQVSRSTLKYLLAILRDLSAWSTNNSLSAVFDTMEPSRTFSKAEGIAASTKPDGYFVVTTEFLACAVTLIAIGPSIAETWFDDMRNWRKEGNKEDWWAHSEGFLLKRVNDCSGRETSMAEDVFHYPSVSIL